ncbi:hypothetical protein Tco_0010524 [Tanacetum coccineum]
MSGSELGEMAPESLKLVVIPKFDMHIFTSTLTLEELNQAIKEFCIPMDLHPRRDENPFFTFLLAVTRYFRDHWFSFKNKSGGRAKKFFKEITSSLKGWKKKFFLIDRRAVPEAMSWRHIDTDVRDDFFTELITMDDFLNLPDLNGTFVSKGDPIPDSERPPIRTTAPLPVGSDLCISSYHDCKEMISHLTTTPKNEVLQEEDLGPKSKQLTDAENLAQVLEEEKRELVAQLAHSEASHQSIIRDFIHTVVNRLQTSMKYRRSLAISLSYTTGWLGGLGLGRTEEDIAKILSNTSNMYIEGSKT